MDIVKIFSSGNNTDYAISKAYILFETMGGCVSKRQRPIPAKQPQKQLQRREDIPPQPAAQTKPEPSLQKPAELPQSIVKQMVIEAKAEKSEAQWLEKQQQAAVKDSRPGHYRQLLVLYQSIHHYYHNHDVDSAALKIDKFEALLARVKSEMKMSQEEIIKHLEEEYQLWGKQVEGQEQNKNLNEEKMEQQLRKTPVLERTYTVEHTVHPYDPQLMQQIRKEHKLIIDSVENMDSPGWEENERSEGMVVYTRKEADDTAGALFQVDLQIPFQHFLIMVGSPNHYRDCLPFVKESREEKKFARNCKLGYALVDFPIISCRESFFEALAYSRIRTHGQFFLTVVTLYGRQDLQDFLGYKVVDNDKYVQILYKYLVGRYVPIREGYGKLTMSANVDFGMNFLPFFLKQFIIKTFIKDMLKMMFKGSKNFKGSGWEDQIQKDSDSFVFFKNELDAFLRQNKDRIDNQKGQPQTGK